MDETDISEILLKAPIMPERSIGNTGSMDDKWRVSVGSVKAIICRMGYTEVAAYEISKYSNSVKVPPTVLRPIPPDLDIWDAYPPHSRTDMSVQLWIEDGSEYQNGSPEWHEAEKNHEAFDYVINNQDRNWTNMLYSPNSGIWAIDHQWDLTFGRDRGYWRPTAREIHFPVEDVEMVENLSIHRNTLEPTLNTLIGQSLTDATYQRIGELAAR